MCPHPGGRETQNEATFAGLELLERKAGAVCGDCRICAWCGRSDRSVMGRRRQEMTSRAKDKTAAAMAAVVNLIGIFSRGDKI